MEFLSQGESIASIVLACFTFIMLACFKGTISKSIYMGNGKFEIFEKKRVNKLSKRRNNNEFIIARNVYKEN